MSLQKLMHNYARYNLWANETLTDWFTTQPAVFLSQQVLSSFPSIAKTFAHIRDTEKFWLGILQGHARQEWESFNGGDDAVIPDLIQQSATLCNYITALSETELLSYCLIDTPWAQGQQPAYEFIQHCFNHGTYHRGQMITIARNLGTSDLPNTDYNFYNMMRQA